MVYELVERKGEISTEQRAFNQLGKENLILDIVSRG